MPELRRDCGYCALTRTSSTAGLDQAGGGRVGRLDQDPDRLAGERVEDTVLVAQAPLRFIAAPSAWNTVAVVDPSTRTRR